MVVTAPTRIEPAFALQGRFAIRAAENSASGNYRWSHRPESDELDFVAPTGQTVVRLSRNDRAILLTMADGKTRRASSWSELTQAAVGVPLPVDALVYWIQAAPALGGQPARSGPDGLSQFGWDVRWGPFVADDYGSRTRKLTLIYGDDIEVRLTIDQREVPGS